MTKVSTMHQEKIAEGKSQKSDEHDWKTIGNSLNSKYQGKILSILQINSAICRVTLSPELSDAEAVEMAKNIGLHIRNSTAGINIATPSVQVFINGKAVAFARPEGLDYIAEISR